MHLCWLIKELSVPNAPTINNEKEIDRYCDQLMKKLLDDNEWDKILAKACDVFSEKQAAWISQKGHSYKYGIKESTEFFTYLKTSLYLQIPAKSKGKESDSDTLRFRGTVVKTRLDRNGYYYGFITRQPQDIFFHEKDNPGLSFVDLTEKEVLYNIITDGMSGNEKAIAVVPIE